MNETFATVVSNEHRGGGYYTISVELPPTFDTPVAGNFMMISTGEKSCALLRRPMAFYDFKATKTSVTAQILYAVFGKGTLGLSKVKRGESLSLLGPLGNSFSFPKENERYIVLGGGIGAAPFFLWGKQLSAKQKERSAFFFGFREKTQTGFLKDFQKHKIKPKVQINGNLIDFFKTSNAKNSFDRILACGPTPMLEAVTRLSEELKIPCELSLEARMGCGIGVCLSCVCENGLVCKNGPVFTVQPHEQR